MRLRGFEPPQTLLFTRPSTQAIDVTSGLCGVLKCSQVLSVWAPDWAPGRRDDRLRVGDVLQADRRRRGLRDLPRWRERLGTGWHALIAKEAEDPPWAARRSVLRTRTSPFSKVARRDAGTAAMSGDPGLGAKGPLRRVAQAWRGRRPRHRPSISKAREASERGVGSCARPGVDTTRPTRSPRSRRGRARRLRRHAAIGCPVPARAQAVVRSPGRCA